MKRTKRFTLRRVALGLAVLAVLAPAAQAKPTPTKSSSQIAPAQLELWSYDAGASSVAIAPDDIAFSRPSNVGKPSVAATGDGDDIGVGAVGGFGVALVLLIGGTALAIRHGRKTRLSPA